MQELISELMQNGRADLLIVGMAVAIILLLAQLHKINKANKKIDAVVKSVEDYLRVILEEDDADSKDTAGQAQRVKRAAASDDREEESKEQNQLISAVLQEIFP